MDMDMATMDTMARGPLRLSQDVDIMAMVMVMDMAMVIMDIMVRGLLMLSQLLLLSPAMDMVMDMVMDTDMVMVMVTMDTMARGPLSQDTDIMAMDMAMVMDMDMVMAMYMDTMVKQKAKCCYFLEFSTPEVDHNRSSQHKHTC